MENITSDISYKLFIFLFITKEPSMTKPLGLSMRSKPRDADHLATTSNL